MYFSAALAGVSALALSGIAQGLAVTRLQPRSSNSNLDLTDFSQASNLITRQSGISINAGSNETGIDVGVDVGLSSSGACSGNTATTRSQWCNYNINTDYTTIVPNTGRTVEYWWELKNVTIAPDGVERVVLTVNGTLPGPTLFANWGDTVVVHLTNGLTNNGTGIHWHGIRQNFTNSQDGVPSIIQCPVAPGDSITYKWRATQYGTSWYHSHFALQAWEGVFGPIVIAGPASADYDVDAGSLFLGDWSHQTVDAQYTYAQTIGVPVQDNGLINGTNVYNGGGKRFEMNVKSGSKYRLRLINPSVDTFMDFSIDNHTLEVIAADFVPIEPYYTSVIGLGAGQRYDVILHANQSAIASDFWLRAVPDVFCSDNANTNNIKGIIHYGSSTGTPTTQPFTTDDSYTDCNDPPMASLVPVVKKNVGNDQQFQEEEVSVNIQNGLFKWYMNNITFLSEWDDPTSLQILNGNDTFKTQQAVIELDTPNEWFYMAIEQGDRGTHPIHLHGHDFYIVAQGDGAYSSSTPLQLTNPPRRDTAMLQVNSHLVIAFQADNPGIWLMHCHIGFHSEEGFALQFVERYDEIAALYSESAVQKTCDNWDSYTKNNMVVQDETESGI